MKILIELDIDNESARKAGYDIDTIADFSKRTLRDYWFDELIKLKDEELEPENDYLHITDSSSTINVYKRE
jgi:hypothetical protein